MENGLVVKEQEVVEKPRKGAKDMITPYAQDIRWTIVDTMYIDEYMNETDGFGRVWIGIRTSLDGGVDEDFEVTDWRTIRIVAEARRRLEELAEAVDEAYLKGDREEMIMLGMNPDTLSGYIALVIKSICWGKYEEKIIMDNSWHTADMSTDW